MENKKTNRLIRSISPYLQQHAHNPVDWYEWGPEAFARAEAENKLMLISIGYSACHWCHVMAHECFEDEATAEIMNRHFVCIKADREEHPDVDQLYMDACQLVNGNGGWPLNAFALPDKRPVHAMTYAPRAQWQKTMLAISDLWENKTAMAYEYAEKLSAGIRSLSLPPGLNPARPEIQKLSTAAKAGFVARFDERHGGLQGAPKFPLPSSWYFLLKYSRLNKDKQAEEMALLTLKNMAQGGIYDLAGGGFARYSTDERWFAPHFEKMLYDNAQLISLYSYAYALTQDPFYKETAMNTIAFCKNEWLNRDGLYMSAMDADSEGVEGFYYTYTYEELEAVLGSDCDRFASLFQCSREGNWEHGRNILYAAGNSARDTEAPFKDRTASDEFSKNCLARLLEYRKQRTPPGLDDKCICSWNSLMLKALSEAALYLQESALIEDAENLASDILQHFFKDGTLYRIFKNGEWKIQAFLEDHAALCDAFCALYQCTFKEEDLEHARKFCEISIDRFYHADRGFFVFSSGPDAVGKKYDTGDDVISSGNSMMAHNLWKLSWYFDRKDWRDMADKMLDAMAELTEQSGPWYSNWASLSLYREHGTKQFVLSAAASVNRNFPFRNHCAEPNAILGYAGNKTSIPLFRGKEYSGKKLIFPCKDMICFQPEPAE